MNRQIRWILETSVGILIVCAIWECGVRVFKVPSFILPPPTDVFAEGLSKAPILWKHTIETMVGTFISLTVGAVIGVFLGFIIGYSSTVSRILYPLLGGFHALPKSAFVPILAVWFGIGFLPKVLAGILIAFFPVVVNVVTGLTTIEPELWDMLKTLGASKTQVFYKVGIPRTIPYFLGSMKVAAAGAFIGNIVGEMLASGSGLGYVLLLATSRLNMALAFSALAILFVMGMAIFLCFDGLEGKIARWAYRSQEVLVIG